MTYKRVLMPAALTVSSLESTLYREIRPLSRRALLLDLSPCQFMEVPVLLHLISFLKKRLAWNLPTSLRLPKSQSVLDFLQIWRFPEAFVEATGTDLNQICEGTNSDYFDNPPPETRARYAGRLVHTDDGWERLLSMRYLEINTFHRQLRLFNSSLALTEAAKWKHIGDVLHRALRGPGNLFASRIVYEALMNAVRHPGASLIQTASYLRWPKNEEDGSGFFTISFWDDGLSIVGTLRTALQSGRSIRPVYNLGIQASYRIRYQEGYGAISEPEIVKSDRRLGVNDDDDSLLLAAAFPGVSSNPSSHQTHPETKATIEDTELLLPGMGLYLLSNAAISVYGGQVFVRSGHYRMTLSAPEGNEDFTVEIRHYKRWPRVLGNLLTVKLPLEYLRNTAYD